MSFVTPKRICFSSWKSECNPLLYEAINNKLSKYLENNVWKISILEPNKLLEETSKFKNIYED